MLMLLAYRPQARHSNPALRVLHDGLTAARVSCTELVLAPLTEAEALQLARAHAPAETTDASLRAVVDDAQAVRC